MVSRENEDMGETTPERDVDGADDGRSLNERIERLPIEDRIRATWDLIYALEERGL